MARRFFLMGALAVLGGMFFAPGVPRAGAA